MNGELIATPTLSGKMTIPTTGGGSTLITKTITENGTYNASSDNADGYSQVVVNVASGGNDGLEMLFQGREAGIDNAHKIDFTYDYTEGTNYDNYLSFDINDREFTVLQDFNALIIPWTYNYREALSSYSQGKLFLNNQLLKEWTVNYTLAGDYKGVPIIVSLGTGDTLYGYTPNSDGYPQQNIKICRIKDQDSFDVLEEMFTFYNQEPLIDIYKDFNNV